MFNEKLNVIILAAGKGSRMCSAVPKIMHYIGGKPMIAHLLDTVIQLKVKQIYVVYSSIHGSFVDKYNTQSINWIVQSNPFGTGHAVQQVLPLLSDDQDNIMILYADVPFIKVKTLKKLLSIKFDKKNAIGLLTATLSNPEGYGRIIRDHYGKVIKIIEDTDINQQQNVINEINTGVLVTSVHYLKRWLSKITNNNLQCEYYLTDIINIAWKEGYITNTVEPDSINEIQGINNKLQLAQIERLYQKRQTKKLSLAGVMFADINRFNLRGDLLHGQDVYIDTNVIVEGKVLLGNRVVISTGCILKDSVIGDDVKILPYTIIEDTKIDMNSVIGPFARLRSGNALEKFSQVGNFVEIKNTHFGQGSKVNHLSYIGDSDIGVTVNIGAGTITCNYDGMSKHRTKIGDNVFVGSDTQLVAPVIIGKNATIGAGTTVTQDVCEGETVISRVRQFVIKNKNK
ncbi:bifunctional UDP-N-acetylglucosamine diphosphorylase/glucosamine-1-phosphate N-acetyltransferase GlmU [Blochmannia endosymbiont of Camponotus (Colobopsis) obliquus]|uniref:bifunctional UDP-N-acetylglucosamine diphosphorylase/glucosamine-1-phosphate N-acetyltransferase GlmU n=1 Tax=Blochmannia endosymbiont of Camponotus (Colobopsis) obliquus TaxID=1505597 RepID=UPI00061A61A3|nr:bifunctional UDP-N-acetylglucosamine diphosphorylase/glucosamine-1-phosphate N-acetyltransferase GlmU [Blochmannia endosymbiont of Camponotus (Colobopsis) obliquus]AKC60195.1 Bifunctional protein GlmU [Blochmannia endosymbiont of Camponotus (Colobopsis) obliquus]